MAAVDRDCKENKKMRLDSSKCETKRFGGQGCLVVMDMKLLYFASCLSQTTLAGHDIT